MVRTCTASGYVLMKSVTRIVIPDILRMTCRVEHPEMPYQTSGYPLSGIEQTSIMHQCTTVYTSSSIVRCMLLCSVEPWMHEVDETVPPLDTEYLISSKR